MQKTNKKKVRYTKAPKSIKIKKGGVNLVSQAFIKKGVSNLQAKSHVNRGDTVVVISGDDKGKIGKVLEIFRDSGKLIVEGVNIIKRHQKSQGPGRPGEIIESEAPFFTSKVMQWDEAKKKASRVAMKIEGETKTRVYKTSGEQID